MARSGRFGRVPTEAPDLTSAIVSMMNQWQAARDANIVDAWKTGSDFEGERVTDGRLLSYMRERRNSYSRDEPEWDEWNTLEEQYRFNIAEQKALLRYDQASAAAAGIVNPEKSLAAQRAASQSMVAFYRGWAAKVPRNSEAWRDVMRSAAQFAKAAQAAKAQQARADRAERSSESDKPTEYERYVSRRDAIETGEVKPFDDFMDALSGYAAVSGLITPGQSVLDLNVNEAATFGALLDGVQSSPQWPQIRRLLERSMPGSTWNGHLSLDTIDRLGRKADEGLRDLIGLARRYPGDMSGYIQQYKDRRRQLTVLTSLDERVSASEQIAKAYMAYQQDRAQSDDPNDILKANQTFIKGLKGAMHTALQGNDPFLVGELRMGIASLSGDTKTVTGLDPEQRTPVWGVGDLERGAQDVVELNKQAADLKAHPERYSLAPSLEVTQGDQATLDGFGMPNQRFRVLDAQVDAMPGSGFKIATTDAHGNVVSKYLQGNPVFFEPPERRTDDVPDAIVAYDGGKALWKVPATTYAMGPDGKPVPQTEWVPVEWDPIKGTGLRIQKVAGEFVAVGYTPQIGAAVHTLAQQIQAGTGGQAPAKEMLTAEQTATLAQAGTDAAARDKARRQMLLGYGVVETSPGNYAPARGAANAPTQDRIDEIVDTVNGAIATQYPATTAEDDPITALMGNDTTPNGLRAGAATAGHNPYISHFSDLTLAMAGDPGRADPAARDAYIAIMATESGMTPERLALATQDLDRVIAGVTIRDRMNDDEDGSGRLGAGFFAGRTTANADSARERWGYTVRTLTKDPAQQERLDRVFDTAPAAVRNVAKTAVTSIANLFGPTRPMTVPGLPAPDRFGIQPTRTAPNIQIPPNLQPLRTASGLQPQQASMRPPGLTQATRIAPLAPKRPARSNPLVNLAVHMAQTTRLQAAPAPRRPTTVTGGLAPAPTRTAYRTPTRTASGLTPAPTTTSSTYRTYRPPGAY